MKNLYRKLSLQRILVAGAHGHFKDIFKKGMQLVLRRMNKYGLKFPYMVALEVTNDWHLQLHHVSLFSTD